MATLSHSHNFQDFELLKNEVILSEEQDHSLKEVKGLNANGQDRYDECPYPETFYDNHFEKMSS